MFQSTKPSEIPRMDVDISLSVQLRLPIFKQETVCSERELRSEDEVSQSREVLGLDWKG